jgi:nucleoid-associated protein YgaU
LGCDDQRVAARAAAVRRRHILLGLVAVAAVIALAVPWGTRADHALAAPARAGATLSPHSVYVVQPGDTLWSIAQRINPQGDPRALMTPLSEQVGGDGIRPGERLLLP